jgi:hypothetical protein
MNELRFFSISFTKLPKQMNAFQLTGLASLATQKSETIDMTENSRDRSWEIAKGEVELPLESWGEI